jgi:hypothetical protein
LLPRSGLERSDFVLLAHTDEIWQSFQCRLLGVDRKWLTCSANDPSGH